MCVNSAHQLAPNEIANKKKFRKHSHSLSSPQTYTLQTDTGIPHEMFINMKWQFADINNCKSNIQKTNPNKYKDALTAV